MTFVLCWIPSKGNGKQHKIFEKYLKDVVGPLVSLAKAAAPGKQSAPTSI